ncbi:NAD-dependent epimerase/dehydratase family protein [Rugosimonospora africana]|uniref:Reductase n=1 Tax=Rugosimonospora africana TaxID=556532 RepID=A0A8J3QSL5_9ACTN|nr:NAD-dependent epimerase/dehydratase family protein [Rugosimonospora africana]GIH15247.1 reductase [Rugosimonospora africana]
MRIVVIGATGHVGGYLIPRLVAAGHDVVAVSRGTQILYRQHPAWEKVTRVLIDRDKEELAGRFGEQIADLNADVVVDMVCFTRASAEHLVDALRGRARLLVSCSTIWVHGTLSEVPAGEEADLQAWGEYGLGKLDMERFLFDQSSRPGGLPTVILRPGHISGPGWAAINPVGNLDVEVWETLAAGRRLLVPNLGLETLHHVHADDVAQAFELAIARHAEAAGEAFHVTSEHALTVRGFATAVAGWFGRRADLEFVPLEEFVRRSDAEHAMISSEHVTRSHSVSIAKAQRLLGYRPRYTSLRAVAESVKSLSDAGRVHLDDSALAGLTEVAGLTEAAGLTAAAEG